MREVTEKEAPPAPGNLHPRYMLGVLESTHTVHKSFSGHQNNVSEKKIFVFSPFIERLWAFCIFEIVPFSSSNNRHFMATDLSAISIFRKLFRTNHHPNMCRFGRLGIHYLLIILLGFFMIFDLRYMGLNINGYLLQQSPLLQGYETRD